MDTWSKLLLGGRATSATSATEPESNLGWRQIAEIAAMLPPRGPDALLVSQATYDWLQRRLPQAKRVIDTPLGTLPALGMPIVVLYGIADGVLVEGTRKPWGWQQGQATRIAEYFRETVL